MNGFVIAPDGFSGTLASSYADNAALAAENLVFLPAAGFRNRTAVDYVGSCGHYWSSSAKNEYNLTHYTFFDGSDPDFSQDGGRYYGYSVRLVTECQ